MVDTIEPRKRPKSKSQGASGSGPSDVSVEKPGTSVPAIREKALPAAQDLLPEERSDFLQRLLQSDRATDELEQPAEIVPDEVVEVLVFRLGTENYGIEIQQVAEIIRYAEPTAVPHTVSFLDGIISLRGRMIPVVNAAKRLGHDPSSPDKKTRIVVLHDHAEFTGILVDSATQVLRLPRKNIEPPPFVVTGVDAEFIDAVCEHKGQMIILLNLDRFLQLV